MNYGLVIPALSLVCALLGIGKLRAQESSLTALERSQMAQRLCLWLVFFAITLAAEVVVGFVFAVFVAQASWDNGPWLAVSVVHAIACGLAPIALAAYIAKKRSNRNVYFSSKFQRWTPAKCFCCWVTASLLWGLAVGVLWMGWVPALRIHRYGGWVDNTQSNALWAVYVVACFLPLCSF
ncbi:hypothetical protein M3J09_005929 [Ascochyta lentis]